MATSKRGLDESGWFVCPFGYCLQVEAAPIDDVLFVRLLPDLKNYGEARAWLETKKRSGEWMRAEGIWLGREMRVASLQEADDDPRILRARLELKETAELPLVLPRAA